MTDSPTKPAPPDTVDPQSFSLPGSIAERVDMMLGVLARGVVDCMVLATGAHPDLTEGPPREPDVRQKPSAISSWQAARSAELRDAARLTDAGAYLMIGYAKLRGQFSQDFTIRHHDRQDGGKRRVRNTTITKRFAVPTREAVSQTAIDAAETADLTRHLAAVARKASLRRSAKSAHKQTPAESRAAIKRKLEEVIKGETAAETRATAKGPTPSPGK